MAQSATPLAGCSATRPDPRQQRLTSGSCKERRGRTGGRRGAWTRTHATVSPASSRLAFGS
eukprot:1143997-Prymnesium_polylepis.1